MFDKQILTPDDIRYLIQYAIQPAVYMGQPCLFPKISHLRVGGPYTFADYFVPPGKIARWFGKNNGRVRNNMANFLDALKSEFADYDFYLEIDATYIRVRYTITPLPTYTRGGLPYYGDAATPPPPLPHYTPADAGAPPSYQEVLKTSFIKNQCMVCKASALKIMFEECGHISMCSECFNLKKVCPIENCGADAGIHKVNFLAASFTNTKSDTEVDTHVYRPHLGRTPLFIRDRCTLCKQAPLEITFVGCGHVMCQKCARSHSTCPIADCTSLKPGKLTVTFAQEQYAAI